MANDVLNDIIAMLRANELSLADDPVEARPQFEAMFGDLPMPEGVRVEPGEVGGIAGLWLEPDDAADGPVALYLHGGGYVIGSANAYKAIAGGLSAASGLRMFLPDYRLAPEHGYPAAPDDVLSSYAALTAGGAQVVVAGDSAGGGLVMSLLLNASKRGLTQPACAVLWSPWADLSCSLPSIAANAENDPTLDLGGLQACAARYLGERVPDDEILRCLHADLGGLAPLLIQVGSIEILLDDALGLARQAAMHGTACQLEIWPGMPHVFQAFAPALTEATDALRNSAAFIERHLGRD